MFNLLKYYFLTSFLRQKSDKDLKEVKNLFKGKILDIGGGRVRGRFKIPKEGKVVVVDINKQSFPDVVANVEKLPFKNNSFDVVKATELFEHVKNPKKGIGECIRVLKPGGYFVLSMPFMFPIHADPSDYQRWTDIKIKEILRHYPIKIKKFKIQGYYFTVLGDMVKKPILNLPFFIRYLLYLTILPLIYLLVYFDDRISKHNSLLNKYHLGYFVVCQKNKS